MATFCVIDRASKSQDVDAEKMRAFAARAGKILKDKAVEEVPEHGARVSGKPRRTPAGGGCTCVCTFEIFLAFLFRGVAYVCCLARIVVVVFVIVLRGI